MNKTDLTNIIDSHFHIMEMKKKGLEISSILENIYSQGFLYGLDIGIKLSDFNERLEYAKKYKKLFLSIGLYPSESDNVNIEKDLKEIEAIAAKNPEVIAIGEIGLDYYRNYSDKESQIELFKKQLEIALKLNLPVIIHNRNADEDVYNTLKLFPDIKGVIHCFSSDNYWADKFIELGFYISFSGSVTYKNSQKQQEACKNIPENKLLIETDAPYLAAQKIRGKLNTPEYIKYTYEFIAELRNTDINILKKTVINNFERLFNLPE